MSAITSEIDIMSAALNRLGIQGIQYLPSQPSEEVVFDLAVVQTAYPQVLAQELSAYDWTFARTTQLLAQINTTPVHPTFRYVYRVPTDCGNIRDLLTNDGKALLNYEIQGKRVLTLYSEPIYMVYQQNYIEVENMPSMFRTLLITALSAEVAFALTADKTLATNLKNEHKGLRAQTITRDFQQTEPEQIITLSSSRLLRARGC